MREKGLKLKILAFDTHDLQLAITQIMLRNGWEQTSLGKIVRKVKAPYSNTPKLYILDVAKGGKLIVRDREGRVTARVDLAQIKTTDQIMEAARILNNGAAKVIAAGAEHYSNTCPECGGKTERRCAGDKVETCDVCYSCVQKKEGTVDTKKIAKVAAALKEAAGLGHYGASNVRDYFRDGLQNGDTVHHQESGIKARKRYDKALPAGHEYELQHPDGRKFSFDADELDTLAEQASTWADRGAKRK